MSSVGDVMLFAVGAVVVTGILLSAIRTVPLPRS